ncbi:MAG: MFS transporter [Planctomycetota bacterium]|nr:MFS transporter [Planctomycetales bacterium]RLT05503.1 MAG: MFS transporter [Planctomycetota bacterium]
MADRPTTVRYQVLTWLTLAAAVSYLCRNAVSVAESTVRSELGLTLAQSGWFMGAFFWTYAVFQVPCGWFAERVGTRIALSIFAVGWSVATFGIGVAPMFWLLIVAQLIMGVAQAGVFPAACNSIGQWMPLAQRTLGCGVFTAGMQIGAIIASWSVGVLILEFDWRWIFVAFSMPGILWALGFVSWFRERPELTPAVNLQELELIRAGRDTRDVNANDVNPPVADDDWAGLLKIARRPSMLWLCGQQICRASGYMFFASWFPTFLQKTRDVSVAESGYLQGLVFAGTLTGCIFGGILTDWIWRRTGGLRLSRSGVGAAALGACSILILAAWFVQNAELAVALLTLGSFFAALAGPAAFAATIDIGGSRVPQVFGLMNMVGNFAAAACPVVVGKLFEVTADWDLVLLLFAGVYFTGAICWIFVNPQPHVSSN